MLWVEGTKGFTEKYSKGYIILFEYILFSAFWSFCNIPPCHFTGADFIGFVAVFITLKCL